MSVQSHLIRSIELFKLEAAPTGSSVRLFLLFTSSAGWSISLICGALPAPKAWLHPADHSAARARVD